DREPGRVPEGGRQGVPLHPYHERHPRLDDRAVDPRHGESLMLSLLARWIVNAGALLLVAYLYPGVHVRDFYPGVHVRDFVAALVAALVLGLVNAIVRPLLVILTLPVTLLTLGLF